MSGRWLEQLEVGLRVAHATTRTGIVTFEHHGINQRDETVCVAVRAAMMHCAPTQGQPEPGQG